METGAAVLEGTAVLLVGTGNWLSRVGDALETDRGASVRHERSIDDEDGSDLVGAGECLVVDPTGDEAAGLGLVERIAATDPAVATVVAARDGSNSVASRALGAGAADYVAIPPDSVPTEEVCDRIERAVRRTRERTRDRHRARQFDALFEDDRTATWSLDEAGRLERANEAARALLGTGDAGATAGDPFWDLSPWCDDEQLRSDVQRIVAAVQDDRTTGRLVTELPAGERLLELSVVPVADDDGSLGGILVEGEDVTERVSVYRDLRRSEELHRVTLNNMTDTVLVTDDEGAFTYICPNVHFIFGYTAEEIRDLGTIDELLGADLYDPETLEGEGVLKNIETTATDRAGREHTLLVNVREVSIQDGTILYSCRDITTRKQREEALATLQDTARDFLYAETDAEIARHVIEDVPGVLDLEASAVYLYDAAENSLEPVATSTGMERLHGPLPGLPVDGSRLASHSFVEDEPLFFADVHDSPLLENQATDLRSVAYIPLGDHGVFVAGSPAVGQFTTVKRELADLLAATAEAALDRVERETTLREQERELKRRNSDLAELNRVNEIIREIDQALVRAESREEVETSVCQRLTEDDRFDFAWIGTVDAVADRLDPRAWAGESGGYLDAVDLSLETAEEPAARTAATGEVTVVPSVASGLQEADWRKAAVSRDFRSVVSVPLAYDDLPYGVLTVYAATRDAFDDTSRAVLSELGETIASATSAIDRRNALLTTSITRLEFDLGESPFVLSRLARAADCSISFRGGVQQRQGGCDVFVTVEGAAVEAVEAAAEDVLAIESVRRISTDGTGSVLRLGLTEGFLAMELADHGAILRSARADPDTTTIEVDIPETVEEGHVVRYLEEALPVVDLRSKRRIDRSASPTLSAEFLEGLTDRQLEVLQTAYYAGFFESPRESTGEDVAETLGISPTAFYRHTRTVQRKLFSKLFDDVGVSATVNADS